MSKSQVQKRRTLVQMYEFRESELTKGVSSRIVIESEKYSTLTKECLVESEYFT